MTGPCINSNILISYISEITLFGSIKAKQNKTSWEMFYLSKDVLYMFKALSFAMLAIAFFF
jgi:hypothetical protein